MGILAAGSEQKFTILKAINGVMPRIILSASKSSDLLVKCFSILNLNFNLKFSRITRYSVSSTPEAAFVIGGSSRSSTLSVIAQFKNDEWSLYGNLQQSRDSHGSITYGTQTLVIGGWAWDGS